MQQQNFDLNGAMKKYFDAQLALQNDMFATMEAGLQGAIALNRASLRLATRAVDQTFEAAKATTPQLARAIETVATALPVDVETHKRLQGDAHTALTTLAQTTEKAQVAVRDATHQAVDSVDAILMNLEQRSAEGLKVVQHGATQVNRATREAVERAVTTMFSAPVAPVAPSQ